MAGESAGAVAPEERAGCRDHRKAEANMSETGTRTTAGTRNTLDEHGKTSTMGELKGNGNMRRAAALEPRDMFQSSETDHVEEFGALKRGLSSDPETGLSASIQRRNAVGISLLYECVTPGSDSSRVTG